MVQREPFTLASLREDKRLRLHRLRQLQVCRIDKVHEEANRDA